MPAFTRRQFATSIAASAILAPFLRLGERPAHAATGKAKRLLIFYTMGTHPDMWRPTSVVAENNFTFSAMTAPLAAVKQDIVLVDGLVSGSPGDNHGSPEGLTGLGWGFKGKPALISVDQYAGDKLKALGVNSLIPTLLLGTGSTKGQGTGFYRASNLAPISSPLTAFSTVFGGGSATPTQMANLLRRRQSILDLVTGEIGALERRVGASEKAKLDVHVDSLRQLENRLTQSMNPSSSAACVKPAQPSGATDNVLAADQLHIDILMGAFGCDITRVAAIQFGGDGFLPVNMAGLQGEEHGWLHNAQWANLVALEQWLCQRFVDIINKLKAIPEAGGSGTLYDNTLIAWCRDMGDAVNHNQRDMKYVLAGGAGGYLKTDPNGRYLHNGNDNPGSRHERILLSLLDAIGISDFSGFGDQTLPAAAKTPLPGVAA